MKCKCRREPRVLQVPLYLCTFPPSASVCQDQQCLTTENHRHGQPYPCSKFHPTPFPRAVTSSRQVSVDVVAKMLYELIGIVSSPRLPRPAPRESRMLPRVLTRHSQVRPNLAEAKE